MLRAGPFSDERIVRLANRRFVPFYFDLSNRGVAGDPDARKFVVAVKKELGGRSVPTPPVLFMTPAGKLLGEISNYATEDKILAKMLQVLKDNPDYDKPSDEEKAVESPVDKAQIQIDLRKLDKAAEILRDENSATAKYLLGRLAGWAKDWDKMEKHFKMVEDKDLADDVKMERAYKFWFKKNWKGLRDHLKDFPKESNRYTEARYYEGLAQYFLEEKDEALKTWETTIKSCAQDAFIYRADWAYCTIKRGNKGGGFSSRGKRNSCLNRIGYMGRKNPDLKGPKGE